MTKLLCRRPVAFIVVGVAVVVALFHDHGSCIPIIQIANVVDHCCCDEVTNTTTTTTTAPATPTTTAETTTATSTTTTTTTSTTTSSSSESCSTVALTSGGEVYHTCHERCTRTELLCSESDTVAINTRIDDCTAAIHEEFSDWSCGEERLSNMGEAYPTGCFVDHLDDSTKQLKCLLNTYGEDKGCNALAGTAGNGWLKMCMCCRP